VAIELPRGQVLRGGDWVRRFRRPRDRGVAPAERVLHIECDRRRRSRAPPTTSAIATCRCRWARDGFASPPTTCSQRMLEGWARASRARSAVRARSRRLRRAPSPRQRVGPLAGRSTKFRMMNAAPPAAREPLAARRRVQLFAGAGGGVEAGVVARCASAQRWIGDVLELSLASMEAPVLARSARRGDAATRAVRALERRVRSRAARPPSCAPRRADGLFAARLLRDSRAGARLDALDESRIPRHSRRGRRLGIDAAKRSSPTSSRGSRTRCSRR
jgi:hypothetical protein